jgi:phosphatidylglycerophosphate synthase
MKKMNDINQTVSGQKPSIARSGETDRISLRQFWQGRNLDSQLLLDRLTTHNVSIFIAYAGYRLNLTANHISAGSGLFSLLALIAAATMGTESATIPVLTIFALSQVSYILDCADGQLARATGTTSPFGAFLDRAMDLVGIQLQYSAFFIFLYRYYMAAGATFEAQVWLFGGLAFVFFYLARFTVWQFFLHLMPETYEDSKSDPSVASEILKGLIDHQIVVLTMLVFLISPIACLAIYAFQALLLCAIWLRYFKRGLQYTADTKSSS